MICVDTNVIVDVLVSDVNWYHWSSHQIAAARKAGALICGHVVAAELSAQMSSVAELEETLDSLGVEVAGLDMEGAFTAGQAQREYRRRGGGRESLIPDFMIGSHALALGASILTRDPRRFRSYFPSLPLITPETDNG
jgi:predicted nucleic acid-binding protein